MNLINSNSCPKDIGCPLDETEKVIYYIVPIGNLILCSLWLMAFVVSPKFRKSPGDLFIGMICAEIILNVHWFMSAIVNESKLILYILNTIIGNADCDV